MYFHIKMQFLIFNNKSRKGWTLNHKKYVIGIFMRKATLSLLSVSTKSQNGLRVFFSRKIIHSKL